MEGPFLVREALAAGHVTRCEFRRSVSNSMGRNTGPIPPSAPKTSNGMQNCSPSVGRLVR
ncbi:Uncharacterised protein [Mycobacteroides abscessus]|nr:Uncharacterised protein [Mycobacteroides abscessus]SIF74408.1 Uncharacterised protein [Mycobacteroides abscessus subsp. abscessus]